MTKSRAVARKGERSGARQTRTDEEEDTGGTSSSFRKGGSRKSLGIRVSRKRAYLLQAKKFDLIHDGEHLLSIEENVEKALLNTR